MPRPHPLVIQLDAMHRGVVKVKSLELQREQVGEGGELESLRVE